MSDDDDPGLTPQHDPHPLPLHPHGDGGGAPDPDKGKDLGYLVPEVSVTWDAPPSFVPSEPESGGDGPKNVVDVPDFSVDLGSLRTAEAGLLAALRVDTEHYESVRAAVAAAVGDDTFFGPEAKTEYYSPNTVNTVGNMGPPLETNDTPNNEIAAMGAKFAQSINPIQQKTLWMIGNALEMVGKYTAQINGAGQTYAQADAGVRFPEAP